MRLTFDRWRESLLTCLAHSEAVIDFGDDDREDDVDAGRVMAAIVPLVQALRQEIASHLRDNRRGDQNIISTFFRTEIPDKKQLATIKYYYFCWIFLLYYNHFENFTLF